MFPPLMLLTTSSLRELKSNAIDPRAPIKGGMANLPILNSFIDFIINKISGLKGSSFAGNLLRFELLKDFAQMMRLNLMLYDRITSRNISAVSKFFLMTVPSILALEFVSVLGLAIIFFLLWIILTACGLLWFWRMTSSYDSNRNVQGLEGQPYVFLFPRRWTKAANIVVNFILAPLYLQPSKLAVDIILWSSDLWMVSDPCRGGTARNSTNPPLKDSSIFSDPRIFATPLPCTVISSIGLRCCCRRLLSNFFSK